MSDTEESNVTPPPSPKFQKSKVVAAMLQKELAAKMHTQEKIKTIKNYISYKTINLTDIMNPNNTIIDIDLPCTGLDYGNADWFNLSSQDKRLRIQLVHVEQNKKDLMD
jgi:hypothetical protein